MCFVSIDVEELDERSPLKKKRTSTPAKSSSTNTVSTFSSVASSLKIAKSLKIGVFNLIRDNPSVWMATFVKEMEKFGPVENIGSSTLFHLLDRDCQSWLYTYKRKNPLMIWDDFQSDFCSEMQTKYFEKLSVLKKKWRSGDKVQEYSKEQIDSFKMFYPKMNDNELILAAVSGLPKKIQIELDDYRDSKIDDFLHFCGLFDNEPADENS